MLICGNGTWFGGKNKFDWFTESRPLGGVKIFQTNCNRAFSFSHSKDEVGKENVSNVDLSPDMDSYEVISGKSNPSSPSIEDLGAVGGDFYDEMSPENDLSRDSDQGVAAFDPNVNVEDEEADFNYDLEEDERRDMEAEDEEEEEQDDEAENQEELEEESEGDKELSEEEDNVEITLKGAMEESDKDQHPDLRQRIPPKGKKKTES